MEAETHFVNTAEIESRGKLEDVWGGLGGYRGLKSGGELPHFLMLTILPILVESRLVFS